MTKLWKVRFTASLVMLLAVLAAAPRAGAEIYQWEYVDPGNPGQGKQPSTTLAPHGAGANAAPGTNLSNRNLTKAYLIGADLSWYIVYGGNGYPREYVVANLTSANLSQADLTNAIVGGATLINANLSQANLTNTNFSGYSDSSAYSSPRVADLTGANLTGAEVRGANFATNGGSGITLNQLYSTASYQAQDLSGIGLSGHNLTSANLSNQNLTNSTFYAATLSGANLSGAEVRGADFSRYSDPYSSPDITGGITLAQLYSTVSYQAHDLGAIGLARNELAGANLAGQNSSAQVFAVLPTPMSLAGLHSRAQTSRGSQRSRRARSRLFCRPTLRRESQPGKPSECEFRWRRVLLRLHEPRQCEP